MEQRVALVALSKEGPSKGRVVQVLNAERMGREENSLAKQREVGMNYRLVIIISINIIIYLICEIKDNSKYLVRLLQIQMSKRVVL